MIDISLEDTVEQTLNQPNLFKQNLALSETAKFVITSKFNKLNIREKLKQKNKLYSQMEQHNQTPLEYLNQYLAQTNQKVTLLVDETNYAFEHKKNIELLASLKNLNHIKPILVIARMNNTNQIIHNDFADFEKHYIQPVTLQETEQLIKQITNNTQINFSQDAIRAIHQFAGGRPLELYTLLDTLFRPSSAYKQQKFDYQIDDIHKITQLSPEQLGRHFDTPINNYKYTYRHILDDKERQIIKQLVDKQHIPTSEFDPDLIKPLLDLGLVKLVPDKDREMLTINGTLFQKVLAEETKNTENY